MRSGSILGLGNDIVEIERIEQGIAEHGERFIKRLFSEAEIKYCLKYSDPNPHFAGRFCAKEAIAKALGTGFGKSLSWQDIEILNNEEGKPEVNFSPELNERLHNPRVLVSITHIKEYAFATAIWAN